MRCVHDTSGRRATIFQGHVLDGLRALPATCVQTVVTSPPYWGLRDYGLPPSAWGGDSGCVHVWGEAELLPGQTGRTARSGLGNYANGLNGDTIASKIEAQKRPPSASQTCFHCGAWLGCLGLEPTPDLYIAHLVEVFREVRRVLREDGTVWLNLGDSYWSRPNGSIGTSGLEGSIAPHAEHRRTCALRKSYGPDSRFKQGDLMGLPWAMAFALREDGWWLRSDIIWSKRNPLPESVAGVRWERHRIQVGPSRRAVGEKKGEAWDAVGKPGGARGAEDSSSFDSRAEWEDCPGCEDCTPNGGLVLRRGAWRPTKGHEYLFLLAKSDRYFADQEAVREPRTMRPQSRPNGRKAARPDSLLPAQTYSTAQREDLGVDGNPGGRNPRTVWVVATAPYPGAHFATFPPDLVEPCVKAGTSGGGQCEACGSPWAPVVDWAFEPQTDVAQEKGVRGAGEQKPLDQSNGRQGFPRGTTVSTVRGYRPTCLCGAPSAPCLVLDPFSGAGTTALVSLRLGRCFVGCELKPEYVQQSVARIADDAPLLNEVQVVDLETSAARKAADGAA
jgi:DNA modification methylase